MSSHSYETQGQFDAAGGQASRHRARKSYAIEKNHSYQPDYLELNVDSTVGFACFRDTIIVGANGQRSPPFPLPFGGIICVWLTLTALAVTAEERSAFVQRFPPTFLREDEYSGYALLVLPLVYDSDEHQSAATGIKRVRHQAVDIAKWKGGGCCWWTSGIG